jgi:hypothetical protein
MPKLTIGQRTAGKAVAALLKLYKAESKFTQELEELRTSYMPAFEQWLEIILPEWIRMKEILTREEFSTARDFFLTSSQTIYDSLVAKVNPFLSIPNPRLADQMNAYVNALTDLAYRWQLKTRQAGPTLLLDHFLDMTVNKLPEHIRNAEIPIETLEPFLPSAPLPSLQFEVKAYELMFSGRKEIRDRFAKALECYEDKLKASGWRELPSRLERHAYWWFEHYVHRKSYDEIAQSEIYTPDGSMISYESNVGRAVRNFARLIGIESVDRR